MSNFRSKAFNPASKRVEDAEYCDDYYGRHRYGIRFDDGCVHPEAQCGIDAAATQLDALRSEINQWANEVARYKSYAEKFDQEIAALQAKVKELEASQQRQFDKYQAALKSGATSPPTEEGIAAAIRQTEYKYFGDYEFSESQWDAVHCLVNAAHHYLTAEARVKELENGSIRQEYNRIEWIKRAEAAESRALRAQQERDEAYERTAIYIEQREGMIPDWRGFVAELRRLASGPEKEKKE